MKATTDDEKDCGFDSHSRHLDDSLHHLWVWHGKLHVKPQPGFPASQQRLEYHVDAFKHLPTSVYECYRGRYDPKENHVTVLPPNSGVNREVPNRIVRELRKTWPKATIRGWPGTPVDKAMEYTAIFNAVQQACLAADPQEIAGRLTKKHGLMALSLHPVKNQGGSRDWAINMLEVPKEKRKQGVGSAVMQEIAKEADVSGARVLLDPASKDAGHGTTSRNRLIKFYKRFGFKHNKGRNKDYRLSYAMYRNPNE